MADDLGLMQNEILALRDTQEVAQPAQPLDSTTILVAEIRRVRNLDAVGTPLDTNTELVRAWDGVR
jgi:hypothetical protein